MKLVRCINNEGAPTMLHVGQVYQVAVDITAGTDYKDRVITHGYVLADQPYRVPRVWDAPRFEDVTQEQLDEEQRRLEEIEGRTLIEGSVEHEESDDVEKEPGDAAAEENDDAQQ